MWNADCPYLMPSKAPRESQENPSVCKKIDDALGDTKVQVQVKKSHESCDRIAKYSGSTSTSNTPINPEVLTTKIYTALTAISPEIENLCERG